MNVRAFCKIVLMAAFVLLALNQYAVGAGLKVQLLDSRNGRPLGRKKVCASFSRNPNTSVLAPPDAPEVCGRTDSNGSVNVPLPDDSTLQWTRVRMLTNDFVACFATHTFSTAELTKAGAIATNTCGPASSNLTPQAGTIILYGHQMTFWEVLRSMGREL
jgi:hypothetical protein